jgi:hypothetical protein
LPDQSGGIPLLRCFLMPCCAAPSSLVDISFFLGRISLLAEGLPWSNLPVDPMAYARGLDNCPARVSRLARADQRHQDTRTGTVDPLGLLTTKS